LADINTTLTTVETAQALRLSAEEYQMICDYLGRTPNFTELSVYSVMWSEHCSYKNSIVWLKQLPKASSRVLAAAGEENAGILALNEELAVVFKIESHNHPSAIEPYQGAATGVGGIHRDIFTMGARPIASLNSLRFGLPSHPRTQYLIKGVVKGIGDYGNAFGVPTVGGEVYFDSCYQTNPLVNAMSVGIVRRDGIVGAIAKGEGNPVYIVGSATGKDGIHGATFASKDITAASMDELPAVQVGDPFAEKLLLEATMEVIATGAVIGMQDMGAAGIACSTSEMSAKGEVGMIIHLDRVPMRQANMQPFELLLSESQERMLIVAEKGKEALVQAVFDKWDLSCVQIGEVQAEPMLRYYWHGDLVAELPADSLVLGGGAPQYQRPFQEPAYYQAGLAFDSASVPEPDNWLELAEFILGLPHIASKRWIIRQYDSMVGAATLCDFIAAEASLVLVHGTDMALALTTDCNSRYVYHDPFKGTALAIAEAARNIACTGAQPIGITNCLNFASPLNPEIYWQFKESILGMKAACEAFGLPVTGGNVSFYNQSDADGPINPTPTIGMVGVLDNHRKAMTNHFQSVGDFLFILGPISNDLACSSYLLDWHKVKDCPAPELDLSVEFALQALLVLLIDGQWVESAKDISDGGLLVALVESGLTLRVGATLNCPVGIRLDAFLLGEGGGRVMVSVKSERVAGFLNAVRDFPHTSIGQVGGTTISVSGQAIIEIEAAINCWRNGLSQHLTEELMQSQ
jgi:phosphoribosylformylglycinamidine synthase subunit PurL